MLAKDGDGPTDFENGNENGGPAEWDKKEHRVRRLEQGKRTPEKELTRQWEK